MAKSAIESKGRKTSRKWFCFSESEMDVARQLIQLSGESDGRLNEGDDNKDGCAEEKAEESKIGRDAADVYSYTNNNNIGETFEEEDCILWRRKRRFRSVYFLYRSTKPVTAVNAKIRRKCAV